MSNEFKNFKSFGNLKYDSHHDELFNPETGEVVEFNQEHFSILREL